MEYIVTSPDSKFNGEFSGYKFKNGNCITKLDENLKLWFKMLGFRVEIYTKSNKKTENVEEKPKEEANNQETEEK